jgi:replication factor C subunit 3/5
LKELLASCDTELKVEVISYAAEYEYRLRAGQKQIFHLEAFVAKFMSVYKHFLQEMMG